MRSMTPDWIFQILLAVIGILGSGAVWHFISSKQYHVAIWVGFSGLVLLFLVIALYLRNELLKAEEFSPTTAARAKSDNNLGASNKAESDQRSKAQMNRPSTLDNPQLWITYAWEDDTQGDFRYLVQELANVGVTAVYDKVALVPGQRLWDQIGEKISSGPFHGWAYLVTPKSLASQACKEELAYALDRALAAKGESFPLIGLLHGVQIQDLPPALRVRLGVSLSDPKWKEAVRAALERRPPQQ